MKFHKSVRKELQQMLGRQLEEYEKNTPMTKQERRQLRDWVASGNSPYDNGWCFYGEDGNPLDFIAAAHFMQEQWEWFESLSKAEQEKVRRQVHSGYDTDLDRPAFYVTPSTDHFEINEDIPF